MASQRVKLRYGDSLKKYAFKKLLMDKALTDIVSCYDDLVKLNSCKVFID